MKLVLNGFQLFHKLCFLEERDNVASENYVVVSTASPLSIRAHNAKPTSNQLSCISHWWGQEKNWG